MYSCNHWRGGICWFVSLCLSCHHIATLCLSLLTTHCSRRFLCPVLPGVKGGGDRGRWSGDGRVFFLMEGISDKRSEGRRRERSESLQVSLALGALGSPDGPFSSYWRPLYTGSSPEALRPLGENPSPLLLGSDASLSCWPLNLPTHLAMFCIVASPPMNPSSGILSPARTRWWQRNQQNTSDLILALLGWVAPIYSVPRASFWSSVKWGQ